MTRTIYLARSAGSAIAVALAFCSTPLLAQEVTNQTSKPPTTASAPVTTTASPPPIVIDPNPVTIPSQPTTTTTTVPTTTAQPTTTTTTVPAMRSAPVVQALPDPAAEEAPLDAAPAATAPRAVTTGNTAASQPRPAAPAASTADSDPLAAEPMAEINPAPMAAEVPASQAKAPVAAAPESTGGLTQAEATNAVLGGLGVAGLAFLGFLLLRRRRQPEPEPVKRYRATKASGVQPMPELPAETMPSVASKPLAAPVSIAEARNFNLAGGLSNAGASVPLPRTKPVTMEERTALIDRLAAAKPDRANPFRSPKARRRRARMIVQSLDRRFQRGSFIDFSQYPANWPHLARRTQSAVA